MAEETSAQAPGDDPAFPEEHAPADPEERAMTSTVKVDAPWGPEVPVRFRIDVAGRASISSITAGPPRLARRPRRSFWQWLLRRRPEQPALPPGR
jgi:hypothetical protein